MTYDTSDTGPNDNTADGDSSFNSVDSENLSVKSNVLTGGVGSHVVPISGNTGVSDAVDRTVSTPVQDALDLLDAQGFGSGVAKFINGQVNESATISLGQNKRIEGNSAVTRIAAEHGGDGISLTNGDTSEVTNPALRDMMLLGPGEASATAADAIVSTQDTRGLDIDNVEIRDWYGRALYAPQASRCYEATIGDLAILNVDAGDVEALIYFDDRGTANRYGTIRVNPTDGSSASDSDVFRATGGQHVINTINVAGTVRRVVDARTDAQVQVNHINFEPNAQNGTTDGVVFVSGAERVDVNSAALVKPQSTTPSVDFYYYINISPTAGSYLAKPTFRNGATLNNVPVYIGADLDALIRYEGASNEVNNASGGLLSTPIFCMEDGVYKVSTGIGYDGGTNDRKI